MLYGNWLNKDGSNLYKPYDLDSYESYIYIVQTRNHKHRAILTHEDVMDENNEPSEYYVLGDFHKLYKEAVDDIKKFIKEKKARDESKIIVDNYSIVDINEILK